MTDDERNSVIEECARVAGRKLYPDSHPSGLPLWEEGDEIAEAIRLLKRQEESLTMRALRESRDALEALRRGHGVEVSSLCYPALNTVREALGEGEEHSRTYYENIWQSLAEVDLGKIFGKPAKPAGR